VEAAATYEYARVPWEQVAALAAQGWRVMPMPPVAEMKNVLGQMQMGEPLYAMEREVPPGAAGEAERLRSPLLAPHLVAAVRGARPEPW
jgi:hypothetical protein